MKRKVRPVERSYVVTYGNSIALVVDESEDAARAKIINRYWEKRGIRLFSDEVRVRLASSGDRALVRDFGFTGSEEQYRKWMRCIDR